MVHPLPPLTPSDRKGDIWLTEAWIRRVGRGFTLACSGFPSLFDELHQFVAVPAPHRSAHVLLIVVELHPTLGATAVVESVVGCLPEYLDLGHFFSL